MKGMMNLVITLYIHGRHRCHTGNILRRKLFDLEIPAKLKEFMIVGKIGETTYDKQMLLALIIGAVHICIAMTVKAVGQTVRFGFKESLSAWGWLLLVVGFICTGGLSFFKIISEDVSTWAFIVIGGVSAIGIYLLNNIHRNVFVNIGAGVWDTYNMATGLMGDILSYIRLYALGLAGGMLGGVFNRLLHGERCGRTCPGLAVLRTDTDIRAYAEYRHVLPERFRPSSPSDIRGILQEFRLRRQGRSLQTFYSSKEINKLKNK